MQRSAHCCCNCGSSRRCERLTRDGNVVPNDAQEIINFLNKYHAQKVSGPPLHGAFGDLHLDVVRDDFISPLDAVEVINYINARRRRTGEGESEQLSTGVQLTARDLLADELFALLAADVGVQPRRRI